MDIKTQATSRGNLYSFPVGKIEIDPKFNVRLDYGDIAGLAKDIAENGLHQPLIVRSEDGHILLVDGHRRLRAILHAIKTLNAPIESVKCILENKGSNEETRLVAMFGTGVNVKPLTPTEQAKVVKRLVDLNWDVKKIATQFGKTEAFVTQLLELSGASVEIRQAVEKKMITKTAAMKAMKLSSKKCHKLLGKAVGKIKVKDVEKAAEGSASLITAASIRNQIIEVDKLMPKDKVYWKAVKFGLECALGIKALPKE
jgi:ParB/RepB/Spo0J family partition protein